MRNDCADSPLTDSTPLPLIVPTDRGISG